MKRFHLYLLVLAVIVIVALALILSAAPKPGNSLSAYDDQPVSQGVLAQLIIPDGVSASVGRGLALNFPKNISGAPLEINGKPAVVYITAEFCPYCAIERWGLVIALMRFGNFTDSHTPQAALLT